MEKQNSANSRENGQQLNSDRIIIGDLDGHPLREEILEIHNTSCTSLHVSVDCSQQRIQITRRSFNLSLPLNKKNIYSLAGIIEDENQRNLARIQSSQKQKRLRTNLHKKCLQFQRPILTIATARHNELAGSLKKSLLFSTITKIENIPLITLDLQLFKSFQSCQLLIHEKGKQIVKNYLFDASNPIKIGEIPVDSFNHAFKLIKKSKNRLFTQEQVLADCPGILGTFLAKNYDLQNYRILFIISRNDFLHPSQEERNYFEKYSTQLHSVFSRILIKEKYISHLEHLKRALAHTPRPFSIRDKFNHSFYTHGTLIDAQQSTFSLKNGNSLITSVDSTTSLDTDAYHLQRISLLGDLLNTLRHELSNPLFGIKLMADLLASSADDSDTKELLVEIANSCLRGQKIIEDFSYLYQDRNISSPIDLEKLIFETSTLAKSATQGIKKTIEYQGTPTIFRGNPTWISQIVFNLILNSAQALHSHSIPSPEIKITVTYDPKLSISISDNGPGITKKIQEKIFTPFFTTKPKGTGLGLVICTNLAKKLGGRISFINEPDGKGVTFTLWFSNGK